MKFTYKEIDTIIEALQGLSKKKTSPDVSHLMMKAFTAKDELSARNIIDEEIEIMKKKEFENLEFEVFCKSLILRINANKVSLTTELVEKNEELG